MANLAIRDHLREVSLENHFLPAGEGHPPSSRTDLASLAHVVCARSAMSNSTESAQVDRRSRANFPSAASGLVLYLLTLAVEVLLGASTRWLLVYLGAAIVGEMLPLGLSPEGWAWVAALAPLLWSILGFFLPGRGWVWGRRLGIRRPSYEEAAAIDDAFDLLRGVALELPTAGEYAVLDDPVPFAAVRGRIVILSRALIECDALAAVIGHELCHVNTLDGRLTEALNRLSLWDDPLSFSPSEGERPSEVARNPDPRGAIPWALMRLIAQLTGGTVGLRLLAPAWAAYWRSREYAADSYAGSLGQAEDLASYLRDQEQALDVPATGIFNERQHPPVALRIERLLEESSGGGSI
jgi:Zn-dependent protease with chaperone function